MGGVKKVFISEYKKFSGNVPLFFSLLMFMIILFVALPSFYSYFLSSSKPQDEHQQDRGKVISYYKEERAKLSTELDGLIAQDDNFRIEYLNERIAVYDFYISTNTIEKDYLNADIFDGIYSGQKRVAFMFFFLILAQIPFLVFAVFIAITLTASDYSHGKIKNILTAPLKRKDIYFGKALFGLSVITAVMFALAFFAVLFGAGEYNVNIMYIIDGNIHIKKAISVFAMRFFGVYLSSIAFFVVGMMFSEWLKKAYLCAVAALVAYGLLFAMSFVLLGVGIKSGEIESIMHLVPIVCFHFYFVPIGAWYYLQIAVVLIMIACFYLLALKFFKKRDF